MIAAALRIRLGNPLAYGGEARSWEDRKVTTDINGRVLVVKKKGRLRCILEKARQPANATRFPSVSRCANPGDARPPRPLRLAVGGGLKVEAKADVDAKKNGEESPVDVISNLSSIGQEQFGTGGTFGATKSGTGKQKKGGGVSSIALALTSSEL